MCDSVFDTMDADKSGGVTLAEYMEAAGPGMGERYEKEARRGGRGGGRGGRGGGRGGRGGMGGK